MTERWDDWVSWREAAKAPAEEIFTLEASEDGTVSLQSAVKASFTWL